jgi:hypothetical protein
MIPLYQYKRYRGLALNTRFVSVKGKRVRITEWWDTSC